MIVNPDCIVIGGGSAGAMAALGLARRGISVLLLDRRSRKNAGACWINGVERRLFDELDLADLVGEAVFHHADTFVLASSDGRHRVTIDDPPTFEVDMRALNAGLLQRAEVAGARLRFRSKADIGPWNGAGREVRVGSEVFHVPVVIDAAGLTSLRERPHDWSDRAELCTAYQAVYDVKDMDGARAWLAENGSQPDHTLAFSGIEGGFSTLNVSVSEALGHVAILTGAMHRDELRSGGKIAADLVNAQGWIGKRRFGGGGLIPLRPSEPSATEDGLIRVGNAAGHVFPQHGSGVASGMRAADLAAHQASAALQRGDTTRRGLWPFDVAYQRGRGAICAAYQPLRYFSASMTEEDNGALFRSGLMRSSTARAALAIEPPPADPSFVISLLRNLREVAPLLPRIASAGALGLALHALHVRFPTEGPGGEFDRWARRWRWLMRRAAALDPTAVEPSAGASQGDAAA